MESKSFLSLFESEKEMLKEQLTGLTLPKDAEKIQEIVSSYLSKVFDSQGESRMSLTQSEDYILQAAMTLLSAQQKMASEFATMKINFETQTESKSTPNPSTAELESLNKCNTVTLGRREQGTILAGSAIGGIGGGLVFSTWGAVFGAIAGTALVLYYVTNAKENSKTVSIAQKSVLATPNTQTIVVEKAINVDSYLNIVREVCASIDTLIDTYRAQIKRVVNKYESQTKPVLESDYQDLLENIQALLGAYAMESSNPLRAKRIEQRISLLGESLENYDLQSENYNVTNKEYFVFMPSSNVTEDTMVLPAIIKEGKVVMKGKVFTKE